MPELRTKYASSPESAKIARRSVVDFALLAGFSGDTLSDIEISVGEALANAAEHAPRQGASTFEVRAFVDASSLIIEVHDNGLGFNVSSQPEPTSPRFDRLRGYGTTIMRILMDRVEYRDGGTCVRLEKRLPRTIAQMLQDEA